MNKTGARKRSTKAAKINFKHRPVLAGGMLDLFGAATFADLAKYVRDPAYEGLKENRISRFRQGCSLGLGDHWMPIGIYP